MICLRWNNWKKDIIYNTAQQLVKIPQRFVKIILIIRGPLPEWVVDIRRRQELSYGLRTPDTKIIQKYIFFNVILVITEKFSTYWDVFKPTKRIFFFPSSIPPSIVISPLLTEMICFMSCTCARPNLWPSPVFLDKFMSKTSTIDVVVVLKRRTRVNDDGKKRGNQR